MGLFSGIAGIMNPATDYYAGITPPDPEAMKVTLEQYVSQGLLTPEDAQNIMQDPSAFTQITEDPSFKEAQMRALTGLQDVADQGGMTATSKARLHDIAKDEGIRERGAREAILSNAAERGTGGSGLEFLSQLKNQQDSASRQSDRDTQVAADAEQRALQALIDSGTMAGNVRQQDFAHDSAKAQAIDTINRFNTANQNTTNQWNVGNRNEAQAKNLAAKQGIADANTQVRNTNQVQNKGVYQTDFENKLRKAGGEQGFGNQDYNNQQNAISGIESGAADILSGGYTALAKNAATTKANKKAEEDAQWQW